jgi:hypothetical protein
MSGLMTIGKLVEQLRLIADNSDEAKIRINGEYASSLSIALQNPIASVARNNSPLVQLEYDDHRSRVVDISVNGREPEPLPETHYDLRSW